MPRVSQDQLDARRKEILTGARTCFARHGYEGATVRRLEEEMQLCANPTPVTRYLNELHAGPEIGVASTKAFTAQLTVLNMIAWYEGKTVIEEF